MNKINILKILCLIMCIFMLVGCGKEEEKEKEYFRFKDEIVTIYVGETYEIEYETNIKNPDIKVDDEEIASIEGNVATGLSRGYASIYVEVNGSFAQDAVFERWHDIRQTS